MSQVATTDWAPEKLKTLDRAPSEGEIIKAKELIDVISPMGFSLQARKVYNLLLENAHTRMGEPHDEHQIPLSVLRGVHKGNERLDKILQQLMTTVAVIQLHGEKDRRGIRRVQLLGGNDVVKDVNEREGVFKYEFDPRLVAVLLESRVYAQLKKDVAFAFESKSALALYEVVQRRSNLRHLTHEEIDISKLRSLLDVEPDKYATFGALNQRILKPAVTEVNFLCDFSVSMEPIKTGRKITAVRLSWWMKSADDKRRVREELRRSRIGRKARRDDAVEELADFRQKLRADIENAGKPPAIPGLEDEIVY